jgi:hypothetical protein
VRTLVRNLSRLEHFASEAELIFHFGDSAAVP